MKLIDVSVKLNRNLPIWPGSKGFKIEQCNSIAIGDENNVSVLTCDVHTGTHIDAPFHCLRNGKKIEDLEITRLIGEAFVAFLPEIDVITPNDLHGLKLPKTTRKLLLKTKNSLLWANSKGHFYEDFVALTKESAVWLVEHGIDVLGIDYLSIQLYKDKGQDTHLVLLENDVIIIEGLNLLQVEPGLYELICLPLALENIEAAPARVILRQFDNTNIRTFERDSC